MVQSEEYFSHSGILPPPSHLIPRLLSLLFVSNPWRFSNYPQASFMLLQNCHVFCMLLCSEIRHAGKGLPGVSVCVCEGGSGVGRMSMWFHVKPGEWMENLWGYSTGVQVVFYLFISSLHVCLPALLLYKSFLKLRLWVQLSNSRACTKASHFLILSPNCCAYEQCWCDDAVTSIFIQVTTVVPISTKLCPVTSTFNLGWYRS